jgi:hypothetical protein
MGSHSKIMRNGVGTLMDGMRIDFHTHTTRGSADSNMDPFGMIDQAQKIGLEGLYYRAR